MLTFSGCSWKTIIHHFVWKLPWRQSTLRFLYFPLFKGPLFRFFTFSVTEVVIPWFTDIRSFKILIFSKDLSHLTFWPYGIRLAFSQCSEIKPSKFAKNSSNFMKHFNMENAMLSQNCNIWYLGPKN